MSESPDNPPARRGLGVQVWAGLLVSLGLSAWFLWTMHWRELGEVLRQVRLLPLLLSAAVVFCEFFVRSLRWRLLLRPMVPQTRFSDVFAATLVGFAANTLLPARAGEIARPLLAARRTGAPLLSVLATAVMERVYDIFGLVVLLLLTSLTMPAVRDEEGLVRNLQVYGGLFGVAALVAMVVFFTLAGKGGQAAFRRITSLAPAPVARRFDVLFDGFVSGLASTRDLGIQAQAALLSVLLWLNGALAIYVLFAAFSIDLPPSAAGFTSVAIALTVALPQAPGFFGVFHVAIEKTLVLWSVDPTPAKAFAIAFWGVSFVPVTASGLLVLWREGLSLGRIWQGSSLSEVSGPSSSS